MKRVLRQLWCGLWEGHDYNLEKEIDDGYKSWSIFYCNKCGKIKIV